MSRQVAVGLYDEEGTMVVTRVESPPDTTCWDSRVERWLDELGVEWTRVPRLNLAAIDRKASEAAQSRLGRAIDMDVAVVYGTSAEKGDEFPPLIVYSRPGSSRLVVADGLQRLTGFDLIGRREHAAWVVEEPDKFQEIRLCGDPNLRNAKQISMEERLARAAHYMATFNLTQKQAAAMVNAPANRFDEYMRRRAVENRLRSLRVTPPDRKSDLDRLAAIKSDVVLREAATVAALLSSTEVSDMVTAANRSTSEREAVEIVRAAASLKAPPAGAPRSERRGQSPSEQLITYVNRCVGAPPSRNIVDLVPESTQRSQRARLVRAIASAEEVLTWLVQ